VPRTPRIFRTPTPLDLALAQVEPPPTTPALCFPRRDAGPARHARGDSYPYGSDGSGFLPHNHNYWVGYPDYLSELLDRPLVNAACPGETTSSLLTGVFEPAEPHCPAVREADLLPVPYASSQMDFAEAYLRPTNGAAAVRLGTGEGLDLSPDGKWVLT
jgi:hypothetical protein